MCCFSTLFNKILKKGMPAVLFRTLVFVYERQYAWVRWGSVRSDIFPIVNGTRQGSVLSPALFAVYMDEILVTLRQLGVGCYVAGVFMGAFGYCDDLALLAPSRPAMQLMLEACERFGIKNNLIFSTDPDPVKSKTKCVFFSGKRRLDRPAPLTLYGRELPWVSSAAHLGHLLSEEGTMDRDTKDKKAAFITRTTEVRETFSFAHPAEILNAVKLYCCDHYGSMLWDLGGELAGQYFNTWNTCIKLAWDVPRETHSYFLKSLSGGLVTVRSDIIGRFLGFYKGLLASPSTEVNIMARLVVKDVRTTTAKNLRLLEKETGGFGLGSSIHAVKKELQKKATVAPDRDIWRIPYLSKILEQRDRLVYNGEGEDSEELARVKELIEALCSN